MAAVELSYEITGVGPPLYLVHGIGSRKLGWAGLLPHLEDRFTCVTSDLRGHGASPVPATPYSLDDLVADLEALRATLGHEKIHVIGHSLGGMIGPAYARAHPDRALTVGLLSTAAGRTEEDRAKLRGVIAAMEERGIRPVLDTLVQRWYTDDFIAAHPDLIDIRKQQVVDTPAEVFLNVFRIYAATEMAPWLGEVACPCLVLTGGDAARRRAGHPRRPQTRHPDRGARPRRPPRPRLPAAPRRRGLTGVMCGAGRRGRTGRAAAPRRR